MRPGGRSRTSTAAPRAQTGIDFMVGMGVFLLAVGFVFGFAPGLFEPFVSDTGSNMLIADRSGGRLVEDLLVESPEQPGLLNATCTVEFFDPDPPPADCRFETEDLNDALGVHSTANLNVTIEDNGSVLTLTAGGDTATLAAGDDPDPNRDVIVSKRIVLLDGTERDLVVRAW